MLARIDAYLLEKLGISDLPSLKDLASLAPQRHFFVNFSQVQGNRFDPFYHKNEFKELENSLENGKYEVKFLKDLVFPLKT